MKNKNVGFLIVGIAVVIGVIILIFNMSLQNLAEDTCGHGSTCSMYDAFRTQTWISYTIAGLVFIIGLFLIFSKENEKIIIKKVKEKVNVEEKRKPVDYSKLDKDEKVIIRSIEEENGTIFQSDLVEKTGFSKVKVSRILDKLEGRQIIERKRRGMTNVVVLK